jgi:hypothetical protein
LLIYPIRPLRGRRLRILGDREVTRFTNWSGIRESNSRLDLGKVAYYHYTNPAHGKHATWLFIARGFGADKT